MVATNKQSQHLYLGIQEREGERCGDSPLAPDAARFVSAYGETAYLTPYLDDPGLTGQLQSLIEESASPLAQAETCFAVDGLVLGLGSEAPRGWGVQCHLACGVNTGIVVAVEVGGVEAVGSRRLPALLRTVMESFPEAGEVYADRAYLAKAGFEAAAELGIDLYIPFKANSKSSDSGRRQCQAWDEALDLYRHDHEEFQSHYRQHSVVEEVLDTIEAGAGVWACAGTDTAQINAFLISVAAHNVRLVAEWERGAGGEPD